MHRRQPRTRPHPTACRRSVLRKYVARTAAIVTLLAFNACGGGSGSTPGSASPGSAAPVAAFTFTPASPAVGQSVAFADTSVNGPTTWAWTFGDGSSSSLQNPTHAYAAAGSFTVTLVATNARGSSTAASGVVVGTSSSSLGIVLGRPTETSMVASVLAPPGTEVYLEYGTAPGSYATRTAAQAASSNPVTFAIGGLAGDSRYYYRARYRSSADTDYRADTEHAFQTRRPAGSTFRFVVQADPHMDENSSAAVYTQTLANELADGPDLLFDLGDTSMSEKCAIDGTNNCASPSPPSADKVWARNRLMRSFFEGACHSIPLFMALGNHDGEAGWQDLKTDAISARKALFVNPEPDGFYSGNTQASPTVGLLQDYYAFEWGDALFVVLDPFTYTTPKPSKGQEPESWNWTLGAAQYQWLARTLSTSRARYKFVFSHHLVGGNGSEARGGAAFADFYEWGGRNLDGTWAFDKQRPGWQAPIHKLLVDNRVTAWFHGHDHLYAAEALDGVVYQEVPQPSHARYDVPDPGSGYGYRGVVGETIFPSPGHVRVTVSPGEVRVEYVRSVAPGDETSTRKNGAVVHSYVVR